MSFDFEVSQKKLQLIYPFSNTVRCISSRGGIKQERRQHGIQEIKVPTQEKRKADGHRRSIKMILYSKPAAAAAKWLQSCPTLCDPIDGSPSGSPVPGIFQARTLEWVAISFSSVWKWKVKVKSLSCPTLSDLMDCSLPGSSIQGIFQARVLEWGAIAFSDIASLESTKPG